MKTITLTLLIACLAALPAIHLAAADESKADCENNVNYTDANGHPTSGPQPWVGYAQTDSLRNLAGGTIGYDTFRNCEGEHWHGQDSVQSAQDPTNGQGSNAAGCNKADVVTQGTSGAFVGSCAAPDINKGGADPLSGSGMPVVFRVSYKNADGTTPEFYVATDIANVGRAATYLGVCTTGQGLEGAAACPANSVTGHHTGEGRYGVYLRDNTPGNVLAQVVSSLGITKGHVSEGSCDQSTYQTGAYQGDRTQCGRDNTAVTVDSVLP